MDLATAKAQGIAPWDDILEEQPDVIIYRDRFPVTKGHLLFVPRANTPALRQTAFAQADQWGQRMLENGDCDGYNIGLNQNAPAGQTVMYPHVHLIPRRRGDCADPVGGVRAVVPGQANYKKPGYVSPHK